MKNLIFLATVVFLLTFATGCEATELDKETTYETQGTDKDDSVNSGGGGNEDADNEEN